ncbi:uncharacterized protein A1O9_01160 [Exophiala aquamarina CBS 119918]|uniref:DUF7605 domain-containing protein n=1 Tax=Exophiala aquamarina CBS 119918 TaxID=1182545 RepID=A0A072PV11_9EURO|nr:uncharacterized protein A1O9_01160 [Exophiala aquamarina CBS 119918]KEF63183.1 hypothetical protein A1O9_01160 [Exophiala aquamarina CBS 119918]
MAPHVKIEPEPSDERADWKDLPMLTTNYSGSILDHPSFQNACRAEAVILKQLQTALDKLPRGKKRIRLKKKLEKIQFHNSPAKRIVALIGITGSGKSSVLGETVDDRGVAKTSGIGRAVTHIAQEYSQRPDNSSSPYRLVCKFKTEDQRREQMETLLDDWRRLDLGGITPADGEFKIIEENSKAALSVIRTVLGGVNGFNLQHIEYGKNGVTRQAALAVLYRWIGLMRMPEGALQDGNYSQNFDDTKSLQKAIHEFQQTGLWPFVGNMSILFDSEVLKDGLVIADLPGCFDSNHIRAKTADAYLPRAQEIWIVANITRAVDNPVIESIADRYFRGLEDVGDLHQPIVNIICTFAGEIPDDIDWVAENLIDADTLQQAEDEYADAEESGISQEIALAEHHLQSLKMKARNDKVTADIIEEWSSTFGPNQLKVFCVDNKMHRQGGRAKEISGIPELRQYSSNIMAQVVYKNAMESLCVQTPALITSFQTYIDMMKNPSSSQEKEAAFGEKEIQTSTIQWAEWEASVSGGCALVTSTARENSASITQSARMHLKKWESLPYPTIGAFFRRDGIHKPKGSLVQVSWCAQLLGCILSEIRSTFRKLDKCAKSAWTTIKAKMIERFENHEGQYEDGDGLDTVLRLLRSRKNNLKVQLDHEQENFTQQLLQIKRKAVSSDTESYIFNIMQPTFQQGKVDFGKLYACTKSPHTLTNSGPGVKLRNVERLRSAIEDGAFLVAYANKVDKACEELIDATRLRFHAVIKDVADDIKADLEPVIAAQAADCFFQKDPLLQGELDAFMWDITLKKEEMDLNIESAKALGQELWGSDKVTPNHG